MDRNEKQNSFRNMQKSRNSKNKNGGIWILVIGLLILFAALVFFLWKDHSLKTSSSKVINIQENSDVESESQIYETQIIETEVGSDVMAEVRQSNDEMLVQEKLEEDLRNYQNSENIQYAVVGTGDRSNVSVQNTNLELSRDITDISRYFVLSTIYEGIYDGTIHVQDNEMMRGLLVSIMKRAEEGINAAIADPDNDLNKLLQLSNITTKNNLLKQYCERNYLEGTIIDLSGASGITTIANCLQSMKAWLNSTEKEKLEKFLSILKDDIMDINRFDYGYLVNAVKEIAQMDGNDVYWVNEMSPGMDVLLTVQNKERTRGYIFCAFTDKIDAATAKDITDKIYQDIMK